MIYAFGDYELDTHLYELRHAGTPHRLEPQVFNLLAYLLRYRDRVVSKRALLDYLWPDQSITESALSQRIRAARKALGDDGRTQRYIKTLHAQGYRFVAAVEEYGDEAIRPQAPIPATADDARRCKQDEILESANQLIEKLTGVENEIAERVLNLQTDGRGLAESLKKEKSEIQIHNAYKTAINQCIRHFTELKNQAKIVGVRSDYKLNMENALRSLPLFK